MMREAEQLILAYAQAPWRKQLQLIGLFSLALVMVALIASLYLIVSAQAATRGREIQSMQYDIQEMQRQNADLESQLASLTTAARLEERAKELGLQPAQPDQIVYLEVSGYVPRAPANLAPPAEPAVASGPGISPAFSQPLFDWVKDQISQAGLANWINEVTRR
jgi:cell division protein FtsL